MPSKSLFVLFGIIVAVLFFAPQVVDASHQFSCRIVEFTNSVCTNPTGTIVRECSFTDKTDGSCQDGTAYGFPWITINCTDCAAGSCDHVTNECTAGFLAPDPIIPAVDDTITVSKDFVYTWTDMGAPKYRIDVRDSAGQVELNSTTNTSYTTPLNYFDGDYSWRVGSCFDIDCSGTIAWSSFVDFEVDTTAPTPYSITPNPKLFFDSQVVGSGTDDDFFAINNTGGSSIKLDSVTLSNSTDFEVGTSIGPGGITIPGGSNQNIIIYFKPKAPAGMKTTTVTFEIDGDTVTRDAEGVGTTSGGGGLSVSPVLSSFPDTAVGDVTPTKEITLTNNSGGTITFEGITIEGSSPNSFSFASMPDTSDLPNEGIRKVWVYFQPEAEGILVAGVNFKTNEEGVAIGALGGTGLSAGPGPSCTKNADCPPAQPICQAGTCVAGPPPPPILPIVFKNPLKYDSLTGLINAIIDFLFTIAVIVAPVLLVIAGVIFMTAAGEPGRIATARRMLLWTIVGFGIILISKGLVEVLKAILGI